MFETNRIHGHRCGGQLHRVGAYGGVLKIKKCAIHFPKEEEDEEEKKQGACQDCLERVKVVWQSKEGKEDVVSGLVAKNVQVGDLFFFDCVSFDTRAE